MTEQGMVTVARFPDALQAELAQVTLAAEGIDAFVADALSSHLVPIPVPDVNSVRLQVPARDAERAAELLQVPRDTTVDYDEYYDSDAPYPRCPLCNSFNVDEKPLPFLWMMLTVLLLGLPLLVVQRERTCTKCNHHWRR
jgi:hypothetical protein